MPLFARVKALLRRLVVRQEPAWVAVIRARAGL